MAIALLERPLDVHVTPVFQTAAPVPFDLLRNSQDQYPLFDIVGPAPVIDADPVKPGDDVPTWKDLLGTESAPPDATSRYMPHTGSTSFRHIMRELILGRVYDGLETVHRHLREAKERQHERLKQEEAPRLFRALGELSAKLEQD